jgi:hypothetical protein
MKLLSNHIAPIIIATAILAGCTSSVPTDTPGVEQLGLYVLRQEGPEVDAVLGYKFAAQNPGSEWLIIEVALSSPNRASADIARDKVFVRTPAGERVPLATQSEFGEDYAGLRPTIKKADIAADPLDYFPPNRRPCQLQLFTAPGAGVVFDKLSLNDRRACSGRIYFKVPGGVQSGRWTLGIDLEESTVRIPFTI